MNAEFERGLQQLREQATTHVAWWSSRTPIRTALYHLGRGRIDKRLRPTLGGLPRLNSPWQGTDSGRYFGWRCRQANLRGDEAFVVEYIVCPYCTIGWVDQPYTDERYQRRGLAAGGVFAMEDVERGHQPVREVATVQRERLGDLLGLAAEDPA